MGAITRNLAFNVLTGGVMNRPVLEDASLGNVTTIPGAAGGSFTIVQKQTCSADTTIEFTSIGTHKAYLMTFNQVHPSADGADIQFSATFNGSDWNVPKYGGGNEFLSSKNGSYGQHQYRTDHQATNDTGNHKFFRDLGNANEECFNGWLWIMNPHMTTSYKTYHGRFWGSINDIAGSTDGTIAHMFNGFMNATSAVTGFRISPNSGNLATGVITLYGLDQS